MKKIVIAVVVLILVLLLAPFGVGKLAEKRIDEGLAQLTEVAPYLSVVEKKYTTGWFKSEQVVTFEVFGPWMQSVNAAMKKEGVAVDSAMKSGGSGSETEAVSPDEPPVAEEPVTPKAKPELPLRFTVRNEILHGPVLGFSGLGIARVDSKLVLSEEVRKEIEEIFGPKELVQISTTFGFFGGGTTTFTSEGRTITPKKGTVEMSWETSKLAIGYSRNADTLEMDGKWPKFEVNDSSDNSHVVMTDMTMGGTGKRILGDLYDGDFKFGVDKVTVTGKESFELKGLGLSEVVETKGDFTDMSVKMGTGEVTAKELTAMGITLKEVHYDIGVRHLHTPTLVKLVADMKAMYTKPLGDMTDVLAVQKVMFAPLKESGAELLKHDPEFVIDRLGMATADGDGYIKGVVTLKGATLEDFATGSMSIIPKIHADLTIDVSEKMMQKLPNGSASASSGVEAGYLKREGDRLICKILFADGKLTVNGKPQAIPGLGGPPPGAGAEGPPAQE